MYLCLLAVNITLPATLIEKDNPVVSWNKQLKNRNTRPVLSLFCVYLEFHIHTTPVSFCKIMCNSYPTVWLLLQLNDISRQTADNRKPGWCDSMHALPQSNSTLPYKNRRYGTQEAAWEKIWVCQHQIEKLKVWNKFFNGTENYSRMTSQKL